MLSMVVGKVTAAWILSALSPTALPPPAAVPVPPPRAAHTILDLGIGSTLAEAHNRLDTLGTSDGRATRDGGRKEVWTLKETDFSSIAMRTNRKGEIVWITGFVRPGREILFSNLGDLSRASSKSSSQIIWNTPSPRGDYRLVAKGYDGKAAVVYLLSLAVPAPGT
jgi:hypothetical protein